LNELARIRSDNRKLEVEVELNGIFSGVRIVELAQYVYVPGGSVLLADQGAEVIKIEPPGIGDPYRSLRIGDGREVSSVNLAMEQNNRGKKSVALDLKSKDGRDAFLALIRTADVFLTSLRPKALRSLRLDPDDLWAANSKLIYVRANGLGFRGAEADKPGFDASSFWARGGMAYVMSPPGQPVTTPRPALGDHSGSMALAFGIAGALFRREKTGKGTLVETSLLATAVWMLSSDVTYSHAPGYVAHNPDRNRFPLMMAYQTRDARMVQLMLLDPRPHWPGLCRMLGLDELVEDPRFVDHPARTRNGAALAKLIGEKIAGRDWAEWKPIFDTWDAPWELIHTIHDICADPQVLANNMLFDLTMEDGEKVRVVAGPVTFDGRNTLEVPRPSPGLGADTDELLRSAGYSDEAISALIAKRAAQ
jgi:crotonobetainyl-CoA:carnitine CoA-transferase CaiB-like acyl-CoA transferase